MQTDLGWYLKAISTISSVAAISRFSGIDGGFYFKENIIERDLDILEISNGFAKKIN